MTSVGVLSGETGETSVTKHQLGGWCNNYRDRILYYSPVFYFDVEWTLVLSDAGLVEDFYTFNGKNYSRLDKPQRQAERKAQGDEQWDSARDSWSAFVGKREVEYVHSFAAALNKQYGPFDAPPVVFCDFREFNFQRDGNDRLRNAYKTDGVGRHSTDVFRPVEWQPPGSERLRP